MPAVAMALVKTDRCYLNNFWEDRIGELSLITSLVQHRHRIWMSILGKRSVSLT